MDVPESDDVAQKLLEEYAPGLQGKLETKQFSALIQNAVEDPSEFTDTTVLKLARDLHVMRAEVGELSRCLQQHVKRSNEQVGEIKELLRGLGAKGGAPPQDLSA